MYKILYWILGILIFVLLLLGAYIFIQSRNTPATTTPALTDTNTDTNTADNVPPVHVITSANPSVNTFPVLAQDGSTIMVKPFLHNGETVPDTVNPGNNYLAGSIGYCLASGKCPTGYKTTDFTVTYNEGTGQFSVALLTEPLVTARQKAEQFLMDRLGLHRIILCNLRYYVSVPSQVNAKYAGQNLGFSVCPGATVLPAQ